MAISPPAMQAADGPEESVASETANLKFPGLHMHPKSAAPTASCTPPFQEWGWARPAAELARIMESKKTSSTLGFCDPGSRAVSESSLASGGKPSPAKVAHNS
jgi:hypothetical protein